VAADDDAVLELELELEPHAATATTIAMPASTPRTGRALVKNMPHLRSGKKEKVGSIC
jgi:hypothetical protein